MTTFVALYRGNTVGDAKLIAVSAEPELVRYVADCLLAQPVRGDDDPVIAQMERGRRGAIRLIRKEAEE